MDYWVLENMKKRKQYEGARTIKEELAIITGIEITFRKIEGDCEKKSR